MTVAEILLLAPPVLAALLAVTHRSAAGRHRRTR